MISQLCQDLCVECVRKPLICGMMCVALRAVHHRPALMVQNWSVPTYIIYNVQYNMTNAIDATGRDAGGRRGLCLARLQVNILTIIYTISRSIYNKHFKNADHAR